MKFIELPMEIPIWLDPMLLSILSFTKWWFIPYSYQFVNLSLCGPQDGLSLITIMDCPSDREDLRRPRLEAF